MWPFKKRPKYRFMADANTGPRGETWYYTEEWKGFPYRWYALFQVLALMKNGRQKQTLIEFA